MTEEQGEEVRLSLEVHAEKIRGLDRRGLLNVDYEPPKSFEELEFSDPRIKAMVRFWEASMADWRTRYGSIEGYLTFRDFASLSNLSATEAFSSINQSLRDQFGYADANTLYSNSPYDIAGDYAD